MWQWISENAGTIAVSAGLLALIGAIVALQVKGRKKGKSSCGCGCGCCPMAGSCHKQG